MNNQTIKLKCKFCGADGGEIGVPQHILESGIKIEDVTLQMCGVEDHRCHNCEQGKNGKQKRGTYNEEVAEAKQLELEAELRAKAEADSQKQIL